MTGNRSEADLFDGETWWTCPLDDCPGFVDGDPGAGLGDAIDEHLADQHGTTLQEYADRGMDALR